MDIGLCQITDGGVSFTIQYRCPAVEWQTAIEALMLVTEHDGPTMLTRIGVMKALRARKPKLDKCRLTPVSHRASHAARTSSFSIRIIIYWRRPLLTVDASGASRGCPTS